MQGHVTSAWENPPRFSISVKPATSLGKVAVQAVSVLRVALTTRSVMERLPVEILFEIIDCEWLFLCRKLPPIKLTIYPINY